MADEEVVDYVVALEVEDSAEDLEEDSVVEELRIELVVILASSHYSDIVESFFIRRKKYISMPGKCPPFLIGGRK